VLTSNDHVTGFIAQLVREGYRRASIRNRRATTVRLLRWLKLRKRSLGRLDENIVGAFLAWQRAHGGVQPGVPRTLWKFLGYLRGLQVAPMPASPPRPHPHDGVLAEFGQYLRSKRGLQASTAALYERRVRVFLQHAFGDRRPVLRKLQGRTIIEFFRGHMTTMSSSAACETRASLRAFVRFAHISGQVSSDLHSTIPTVRRAANQGPPKYMDESSVQVLLKSCDRHTPAGLRDHAILLVLARLGLRPCELGRLKLTDIDWTRSALFVHGKRGRTDWVPFSREIGAAFARYIRRGRPRCTNSALFLCLQAPYRDLGSSRTISSIVARQLRRSGLAVRRKGGYLLRHSFSARLLRQGASLAELSSALRHSHPLSTKTYVHIQTDQLRLLAQRWPGTVVSR
jgi:site-specific recombinase XerD